MRKVLFVMSVCLLVLGLSTPLRAEDDGSSSGVYQKLTEISDTQKQILDSLEQMKAELQIIKVRSTK